MCGNGTWVLLVVVESGLMKLVYADSLGDTLNALNAAFFDAQVLTKAQREQAAVWIAARQGLPGSYAGMPAPSAQDFTTGLTTFTGERLRTRAGKSHILGEEACRALILLQIKLPEVKAALKRATAGIEQRVTACETSGPATGTYCCGICSCAYWRHLAAGGLSRNEERLVAGMKALKAERLDTGRWRRFPFFYTLLALLEIDPALAVQEIQFAVPACERYLHGRTSNAQYAVRRRRLAEKVMAAV